MKRLLLLLALVVTALAGAQTVPYTKFTLPNGMAVILHEDHSVPIVAVNLWYHVGSKDEPARRSGFAHLFEHLMFMGSNRVPTGEYDKIMEGGGGSNNASTAQDRTNYYDVGPSNLLPTLLWLEADRLEDLGKAMTQKKLDLQREVVLNERRETENSPYGNSEIKLPELMYPEGHPYYFDTIGLPEDLNAATVQDVQNFFATYYVPNNASIAIAGDFDSKTVRPLIEKLFGTLPRRDEPVHRSATEAKLDGVKRLTMVDNVQYPRITMAWHSPAFYAPGDAEMDLAGDVLASGISSRLYQKLIYQDKLATDVSATQNSEKLGSIFTVSVTTKEGVPLDKVEKVVDETLAQFVKEGPTAAELQRQVAQYEFATLSRLQSQQSIADRLNQYEYYYGEPDSFKRDLDRYRTATPDAVRSAAAKVLDPNARVILTVIPQAETPKENPRDVRPTIGTDTAWSPTAPTELKLANGLKVFYWQKRELPLMTVTTLLNRGSEIDPAGKAGVADLTTEMLDQGAGGKSATAFEQALDQLGARFSADASPESTTVSFSSTETNFAKALSLYTDALARPNFEQKEWDRVKQLHEESLNEELDDPSSVSRRMAALQFFGPDHPYGRPVGGTLKSIGGITLDDVKAMHAGVYQPADAMVFAAGSMSPEVFKAELDKTLGQWKGQGSVPGKPSYSAPTPKPLRVFLIEKPGAVQTAIRFVMPAPTEKDPNRIKLDAIGTVLGGTFTSRLNQNLREDKGYTYGAGSSYVLEPSVGSFVAAANVRTDVTGASLKEFLKEFEAIRGGNISDAEVSKVRASMRTDLVQGASTLNGVVGMAIAQYELGRPYTDLGKDLQEMASLTPAQLNVLVKAGIPLESGVLVLVGDKDKILEQLKGLNLPAPVVVEAE